MARSVRTLPMVSAGGYAKISIPDGDWMLIERGYGPLSKMTRADIIEATNKFLEWEGFERMAEPAAAAQTHVEKVKRSAEKLSKEIVDRLFGSSDTNFYSGQLIKKHFHHPGFTGRNPAQWIHNALSSLIVSCHKALEELSSSKTSGFREGECWEQWIRRLTAIVNREGLASSAAKDAVKRKTSRPSPFVLLVSELQSRIPKGARRHCQSHDALAGAIHRARRDSKRDASSPVPSRKMSRPKKHR